jgi:hypothetical protein
VAPDYTKGYKDDGGGITSGKSNMEGSESVVIGQIQLSLQLFLAVVPPHLLYYFSHNFMATQLILPSCPPVVSNRLIIALDEW